MERVILNADDFGLSDAHNKAVFQGYTNGILKCASIIVNTESFQNAMYDVVIKCPELNLGVHLNIIEGKSLTDCPMLTDDNKNFNKGYLYFIIHQFDKNFLTQVEQEFRAQIEKSLENGIKISRIDSHVHTHAIPKIFNIVCSLAQEYNIEYVRTQFEKPYLVFFKCLTLKFMINLVKIILLNCFTCINKLTLKKYNLKTNDYVIGIGYTGMMDKKTVLAGIKVPRDKTLEIIIHPCVYKDDEKNSHYQEFLITQDKSLNAKFLNNK